MLPLGLWGMKWILFLRVRCQVFFDISPLNSHPCYLLQLFLHWHFWGLLVNSSPGSIPHYNNDPPRSSCQFRRLVPPLRGRTNGMTQWCGVSYLIVTRRMLVVNHWVIRKVINAGIVMISRYLPPMLISQQTWIWCHKISLMAGVTSIRPRLATHLYTRPLNHFARNRQTLSEFSLWLIYW